MNKIKTMKEASVLLIAAILVLTVPMAVAQLQHDVGVSEIISPTSGCWRIFDPVNITVKNYGTNSETMDVQVIITEIPGGSVVYLEIIEDVTVYANSEKYVNCPKWIPPPGCGKYIVTACTLLEDDENTMNDCMSVMVTIGTVDIEIIDIWAESLFPTNPFLKKYKVVKANIKNNGCMDCCPINWSFNFTGFKIISGPRVGQNAIDAYGTITISSDLVVGFAWHGTVTVTATDSCCGSSDTETRDVRIVFYLRKMLP